MNKTTDLMIFPMIMSAMTDGAAGYAMQQIRVVHSKPRRGCVVGCRICESPNVTLYRDREGRICGKCRAALAGGDER